MSLQNSINQMSQVNYKKWQCQIHENYGVSDILMVYIGKGYEGKFRFYCQFCAENEEEIWQKASQENKIKIAYYNIINYEQQLTLRAEIPEPKLEAVMPIEKKTKENCRKQILEYESNKSRDEDRVNIFIEQFQSNTKQEVEIARQNALKYFYDLQQLGLNLQKRYHEIIDCSKIKEIIDQNEDKDQLNQEMSKFISERLENTANNQQLQNLCKIFNDKLNLWITDSSKTLGETIINYTKKLTFDSKQAQNVDSFEREVTTCLNKLKNNNNSNIQQQKSLFNNIGQSQYKIENLDQKVESLTTQSQGDEGFAKLLLPITQDGFYQFIFKIANQNQNQQLLVQLGVGNKDNLNSITHSKTFFSSSQDKCNLVQQGQDLSSPERLSSEITVTLNVCLRKNKFYFTDKLRSSKNAMSEKIPFEKQGNYALYIYSKGQVNITLLDYEITKL